MSTELGDRVHAVLLLQRMSETVGVFRALVARVFQAASVSLRPVSLVLVIVIVRYMRVVCRSSGRRRSVVIVCSSFFPLQMQVQIFQSQL